MTPLMRALLLLASGKDTTRVHVRLGGPVRVHTRGRLDAEIVEALGATGQSDLDGLLDDLAHHADWVTADLLAEPVGEFWFDDRAFRVCVGSTYATIRSVPA